ncbi:MAG: NAD(P)/FAD-dependent oxidoreductase [bacterium]|nr:NAD(P)/FAD-dependent oxidoreductase [bacterium]
MHDIDCTIIGGGIVGCAVAAELAGRGLSTVLLEMEEGLGRGTTSRNSEVSHGGMYYPTGSLKARFCVEGRRLLKQFCESAGVGYRECGKLIVAATSDEIPYLEKLLARGMENGVEELRLIDAGELRRLEPQVSACAALYSPRTGIVDAEGAARAWSHLAQEHGAQVMTAARVTGLHPGAGAWTVEITAAGAGRREGWSHTSRIVVNAAGLWADRIAALAGIDTTARGWDLHLVKGNYFAVASEHHGRISRLVYPVPPSHGASLGVHVCLDLGGQMKLGPDVEHLAADPRDAGFDWRVDPALRESFWAGAHRFLPWLRVDDLSPGMSGLRPKLVPTGFADFVVQREEGDLAGLVNLVGIESPGLTSAAALAREVARLVAGMDAA